jgi:hypothetical protein
MNTRASATSPLDIVALDGALGSARRPIRDLPGGRWFCRSGRPRTDGLGCFLSHQ